MLNYDYSVYNQINRDMKIDNNDNIYKAQMGLITARFVSISNSTCNSNDTKFAKMLNISRPAMSSMRNKKAFVNIEHIVRLIDSQPDINLDWLFRGAGDMFCKKNTSIDQSNARIVGNNMSPNGNFSQIDPAVSEVLAKQTNQIDRLISIIEQKL